MDFFYTHLELNFKPFGYAFISIINSNITAMTENDVIFNFILTNNETEVRAIFAEKGYKDISNNTIGCIKTVGFSVNSLRKTFFAIGTASSGLNSTNNLADLKEYL